MYDDLIPTDDLKPDFENRDPLRNLRPGSSRMSSRFRQPPSIGQGELRVDRLPADLPEGVEQILDDPLHGLQGKERETFREIMEEILSE